MAKDFRIMRFSKIHVIALFAFAIISVFSLRSFFATGNPVAFHDLSPMYRLNQLFRPFDFPWDYKSNLGSPNLLPENVVYNIPLIGLSLAFGSVAFAEKILLVLFMALSGFGFYLAFSYLLKSKTAGVVAGLCAMFSPFTLSRWEFGQNTVILAYAVLPFAVLSFFKVMKEGGRLSMFVCGLLTAVMIYANPQVAYMFILFEILYVIFDLAYSGKTGIVKRIAARAVQVCLILAVALVAAFPFFYQLITVNIPVYSTMASEASVAISTLTFTGLIIPQVLLVGFVVLAFLFLWWKSGFTSLYQWWKRGGLTEEYSPFLINAGRQDIQFFGVLGAISLVVIALVIPPFTPVYYWLFTYVPGIGMFRDVGKFLMLTGLTAAFFAGLTAEGFKRYLAKSHFRFRPVKILPILLLSILVFASSWQFLTGNVDGTVGTVQIPTQYQKLDNWLSSQNGQFRIAFLPPASWATNYTWASLWFLNPYVALQAKPTLEIKSEEDLTTSASLVRWAYTALYENRTSSIGKFLSIFGVKYVIVEPDANYISGRADLASFSQASTSAIMSSQNDLQLVDNFSSVLVYENPYQLPLIYQTNGLSLIVGDRAALLSLSNMDFNFSQNPAAFLDDNVGSLPSLIQDAHYIFFQGDPYWSMIVSSLGEKYIVEPWNYAPLSEDPLGLWVNGDLMWYQDNGELNVAPDNYIFTVGASTITVPLGVAAAGDYKVLAQIFDGLPGSQGINFTISNGANYVFKPTVSNDGSYKWVVIGDTSLDSSSKLQISNLGGPAAISKIAVIPESIINETEQKVSNELQESPAQSTYIFDDRAWNYDHTALISDPEANDGRLIDLSNSSVETDFYVFNNDAYMLNLTFQTPRAAATVKVQVDNLVKNVTLNQGSNGFSTVEIGPLDLSQGYHSITIEAENGDARFNVAELSSNTSEAETASNGSATSEVPSYTMNSGSEYTVNPTASYLAFLEAGNGYWNLYGQGEASSGINIFNYGSLFPISDPGGQYTLRYVGLGYVEQGFAVGLIGTFLLAVGFKFLHPKRLVKRKPEK